MSYDEEQQRERRVVVETPTARREVVQTETTHTPERREGISTGMVAAVAITAIALTAIVAWFLTRGNDATETNTNVRVVTQPAPVQSAPVQTTTQPASAQPIIIQQQPAQPIIVPPAATTTTTSSSTTTSDAATSTRSSGTDDASIQTNLDKLKLDDATTTLSSLGISSTVINGKVTLTGNVNSPDMKTRIRNLVKKIKGVSDVDDTQLTVSMP